MSKKPPKRPLYDEYADTPYITRNRELNTTAYGDLGSALENFRNYEQNNDLWQAVADQYSANQWNDLNRNYQQALNRNAARERQRLGTSGASSSLYSSDNLQRYYNDLANNVSSNTAGLYNQLVTQEYNRRLNDIDLYNNLFKQTGQTTEAVDTTNWNIRNQNKYVDWQNDMNDYQYGFWNRFGSMNKGAVAGGAAGMQSGNPWVGLAGAIAGGIGGALSPDSIGGNESVSFGGNIGTALSAGYGAMQDKSGRLAGMLTGVSPSTGSSSSTSAGYSGTLPQVGAYTPYSPSYGQSYNDWLGGESYRNNLGSGYGLNTASLQDTMSNNELMNAMKSRGVIW